MIVKGFSGKPDTVAGIVSFGGVECNQQPAVFTRVSAYKLWLEGNLCRGSQSMPPRWCPNGGSNGTPNKPPIKGGKPFPPKP
jgi:secreted trypsin-like serine protease